MKRAHKSQPLSLEQWIVTIIFRMRGQFNKTSMLIANINILVMISDQEFPFPTINFSLLQGDFQKSVVAPIGASMGFNCHK